MTRAFPIAEPHSVVVIGGGFSGLLTAIHLLDRDPRLVVRLVEKAGRFGLGRAYAAANGDLLLNVRAANMSAFPDRPHHFTDWLVANGGGDGFVSRARYGEYLQSLLREALAKDGRPGRLLLEQDEAVDVECEGERLQVHLAMGRRLPADAVVLAIGLGLPSEATAVGGDLCPPIYFGDPWRIDPDSAPAGDLLLLGSGLTMVDVVLSLARADRRFTVVSRRGLLPQAHDEVTVAPLPDGDLSTPRLVLRHLRAYSSQVGWRSAVDSIRPLTPAIWRSWSLEARRRFLRHARPWWDIHRHRMAPQVAEAIQRLAGGGRLQVIAARLEGLAAEDGRVAARLRLRGAPTGEVRRFAAVINCTGLSGDLACQPLLRGLIERGQLRADALNLGLDVDDAFRVLGPNGLPTPGLFAVGPLTRGARWETVAVPDLRAQSDELSVTVTADLEQRSVARSLARGGCGEGLLLD